MLISIVVPAHQLNGPVKRCLESLQKLDPAPQELWIAVDGGEPELTQYIEKLGLAAVVLPERQGAAYARNTGAARATGDILLFLDSDVVAPNNLLAQVAAGFRRHPAASSLIGSYDDTPGDPGFLSQYRNLMHHYVHQTSTEQVVTFWSGCGAIRRSVFEEIGGFDVNWRSMEDIELGYRLSRVGHRIYLIKDLQVKHLKQWTPGLMLWTDFFGRALPWTRLLWQYRRMENNLNVDWRSRASIVVLGIALLGLVVSLLWVWAIAASLIGAALYIVLNRPFYAFLWRKRGAWFTLRAIPWHMLFYALSGAAFVIGTLQALLQKDSQT